MCVIIDACVRDQFFHKQPSVAGAVLRRWIDERGGKLVYGGKLTDELTQDGRSTRVVRELQEMSRSGRALQYKRTAVNQETERVRHLCSSNDAHVIGLARVSGARVLYSHDARSGLHADFKNPDLVNDPRGAIFQEPEHELLLGHTSACRHGKGTAHSSGELLER